MIEEYINYINNIMKDNQALTAILGGGILYKVMSYVTLVYSYLKRIFLHYFCHTCIINQAEDFSYYARFIRYIGTLVKNPRYVKFSENYPDEIDTGSISKISVGKHLAFFKYHLLVINIVEIQKTGVERNNESCIINIYGLWPRSILKDFSKDMTEFIKAYQKKCNFEYKVTPAGTFGRKITLTKKLDTLFIDNNIKNNLINIINEFESTDKFVRFGIKKKIGILLHGPPGTGKSTFPIILANEYNRDIYNIPPNEKALQSTSSGHFGVSKSILVIDDIDALKISHDRDKNLNVSQNEEVNISTLLRFLDGADLPNDVIIIASTNHLEKLDPAVTRHGRFDHIIEFKQADYNVAKEMVEALCPEKINILDTFTYPISQAEIQAKLLCN